jgi:hypothetical protein
MVKKSFVTLQFVRPMAQKSLNFIKEWGKYWKVFDNIYVFDDKQFYIFFCNPIHQTGIGTDGGILIANELDQSLWQASQKETPSSSQIIFITLFFAGAQLCNCKFYQPLQIVQLCWVDPNGQDHIWTDHCWRCSKISHIWASINTLHISKMIC